MPASQRFIFRSFHLDLWDERLWCGPAVVRLPPKSFAVLTCLVTQAGRLVTKDALLEAVWPHTVVSEDVLTAAIRQLRRVLGDQTHTPQFIETIRGRGYRFIAPVTDAVPHATQPPIVEGKLHPSVARVPPQIFVGREAAIAQVQQWWAWACQGQRQLGFIAGEPGIGKTALVEVCVAQMAAGADVWVASGQCVDHYGAGEAYLPLLEALSRLGQSPQGEMLVALLRHYAPSWLFHLPALLTPADRDALLRTTDQVTPTRMLRELAEALEVLTAIRSLILVLEDLHWCDHATLAWLAYVARRPDPARLLILGTYRPVEVIVGAHPLRHMITELQHHGQCTDMVLDYLSEDAITAYLGQHFGTRPRQAGLAHMLHRHTHGNPLFLRTVVEEMVAQQLLEHTHEGWGVQGGDAAITGIVPESLRRLIEQQLEQLTPDQRAMLDAASVTGSTFTAAAVAAGMAQPEERIDASCATWMREGRFIREEGMETWPDGTVTVCYSFLHALYHEVIYRQVASGARVRLHRRIGLRLEAGYGDQAPTIATTLAMHFARAQDLPRAVQYSRHAADTAMQRAAYQEAVACFEQTLTTLERLPAQGEARLWAIDLRLALDCPLHALGEHGRRLALLEEAERLARALDDPVRLGRVLLMTAQVRRITGDHVGAMVVGQHAFTYTATLDAPALQVEAAHRLGQIYYASGDFSRAARLLRRAVATADQDGIPTTVLRIESRAWLAYPLGALGAFAEGRRHAEEALRLARLDGREAIQIIPHMCLGLLSLAQGDMAQAIRVLEQGVTLCRINDRTNIRPTMAGLGFAVALHGHLAEGRALLEEALSESRRLGALRAHAQRLAWLSEVYHLMGCGEEAWQHARQALTLARQQQARGDEALALYQMGAVHAHATPLAHSQGEAYYQQALALAEALRMRPLQAHCHRGLGTLYAITSRREQARAALVTAIDLYRVMEMTFWLPQTELALAQVDSNR
jgi:DNA-binding winged helix-turn-helix (wHTH) protein/tetratricopeptide (TPR) repeat protein